MLDNDEVIKQILHKYKRDVNVERYALEQFSKRTKNCISYEEINNTLKDNKYNGIYLVSSFDFKLIEPQYTILGLYNYDYRTIFLNVGEYNKHQDISVHELTHAYLNGHSREVLPNEKIEYSSGAGLEEGIASIIQVVSDIDDIDNCDVCAYEFNSHLFKQLNVLYNYSNYKKYPNLLHHVLKEPNDFLLTVTLIYESILSKHIVDNNCVRDISVKSSTVLIKVCDILIEENAKTAMFYQLMNSLNTIYLALADRQMRNMGVINNLFPRLKGLSKNCGMKLSNSVVDNDTQYIKKLIEMINNLLTSYTEMINNLNTNIKVKNMRKK